jgi:hypothetical protein
MKVLNNPKFDCHYTSVCCLSSLNVELRLAESKRMNLRGESVDDAQGVWGCKRHSVDLSCVKLNFFLIKFLIMITYTFLSAQSIPIHLNSPSLIR